MILHSGLPSTRTSWNGCSWSCTEYPAGANLDVLGGAYHTPEGTFVWLADVGWSPIRRCWCTAERSSHGYCNDW